MTDITDTSGTVVHSVAGDLLAGLVEDSGLQHRRAAMRKRNGWCIWSPWSGYLSSTFACTRTECIKLFERDSDTPWRRYREQGFECRPVLFVDAREGSGDA